MIRDLGEVLTQGGREGGTEGGRERGGGGRDGGREGGKDKLMRFYPSSSSALVLTSEKVLATSPGKAGLRL